MTRATTAKLVAEVRQHGCHYAEGTCAECAAAANAAHDWMRDWYGYECNDSRMAASLALAFLLYRKGCAALAGYPQNLWASGSETCESFT